MAVTANHLTTGHDNDVDSAATASVAPGSNKLILISVINNHQNAVVPTSISGNGLTWVMVDEADGVDGGWSKYSLWRAMGASPTSGVITIDFNSVSQQYISWAVVEFDGVDTGGTNGSAAVVQSVDTNTGNVETVTVTLAAFSSTDNATFGGLGLATSRAVTPGTGFTELSEHRQGDSGFSTVQHQWRNDNDTSVDWSWSVNSDSMAIGVEIKAAVTDTVVAAGVDALIIAEKAAAIVVDVGVSVGVDALVIAEQQANVALDVSINAGVDALVIAEQAASIILDVNVNAGLDVLVVSGKQAQVGLGQVIAVSVDALVVSIKQTTIVFDVGVSAGVDALVLSGKQATVSTGTIITATVDALVLSTKQASISVGVDVAAGVDALVMAQLKATVTFVNGATLIFDLPRVGPEIKLSDTLYLEI